MAEVAEHSVTAIVATIVDYTVLVVIAISTAVAGGLGVIGSLILTNERAIVDTTVIVVITIERLVILCTKGQVVAGLTMPIVAQA